MENAGFYELASFACRSQPAGLMIKRMMIGLLFTPLVFLTACGKKKEDVKAPEPPPAAVETVVEAAAEKPPEAQPAKPAPVPVVRALSPEERAAKLGFARYLPPETEVVVSLYSPNKTLQRIKGGKLWKLIDDEMGMDSGDDEAAAQGGPEALFENEMTLAFGKSTSEQAGNLISLNNARTRLLMRAAAMALPAMAESGDPADLMQALAMGSDPAMLRDLLADPQSGLPLLEKLAMPPLYIAFRAAPDGGQAAAQQLAGMIEMLGMFGDMAAATEVEKAGQTFAGYTISGEKVAEMLGANRASMDAMLDSPTVDRLIAAVAKNNLTVLSGLVGDYAILFLGSSADDLVFAASAGESLLAGEALAFCDAHAEKELAAVICGRGDAIQRMIDAGGGLSVIADGLREGFAASEGLGDTRDLETLLRMVAERESALRQLGSTGSTGTAVFFEDGLKIESYGGIDRGAIDWAASNRLGRLGDGENVVLFANMTGDAAYDEKMQAYLEALMETGYALSMKLAELPLEDGELARFKEMAGIFDSKFRTDAVALWEAFSGDFSAGLGAESALVVDLHGSVPTIPGVAQELVDEGKFPRISLLAPVTDRAKLASAWEAMNRSASGILAKISEMNGQEIPMQKPISSEKNAFTTWFFPLPFFNDDFLPSVTVGDEWFAASTSKNQALDLLAKAGEGTATTGMNVMMNFDALRVFVDQSLDLLAKHPDALPMDAEDLEKIRKLSAAMEDFEKLTLHCRRENGVLRSSIHLKTR